MNAANPRRQALVALDVEGVLTPEVWIAVAESTGVDFLRRTTRDEPDYDLLMQGRLGALNDHGVTFGHIMDVISELRPLEGAYEFLQELKSRTQVVLLSDTFEQFAHPLMSHLDFPTILCHELLVADDRIVDYCLRMPDQKAGAVSAFQALNYRVVAAGDSYNDITMLTQADTGILFRAPDNVIGEYPDFPSCTSYEELLELLLHDASH